MKTDDSPGAAVARGIVPESGCKPSDAELAVTISSLSASARPGAAAMRASAASPAARRSERGVI